MIEIRDYRPADWDAIAAAHDAARLQELGYSVGVEAFLTLEQTAEDEGLFDDRLWVAELDGAVVGFLAYADGELTWMYVHPAHQGRGVGAALIERLFAHVEAEGVDRVELTVLDGNPARRLYERSGFTLVETKTGGLVGNESFQATGHVMERRLRR
ncbi:GNAT family N-acetyltransferase [Modestobacter italicus]|uniref:GNAT family N-acetyltransferase n=1 Tax=Modestobacter italicus (strain DSM 44449 / CECT 9708 / BC 501) TaxID=2732864 RepID=UPI001C98848A|nr:GNAT family N-acetyltransferase [Modestobacter italicus]